MKLVMSRTFSTEGIILKRSNSGEADRVLTILTKDRGKIACIAKGVRKLSSSKRSSLEPGMLSKLFFVEGKGMLILTQAQVIEDFATTRVSLKSTRDLVQVLEIFDHLFVDEESQEELFNHAVEMMHEVAAAVTGEAGARARLAGQLRELLEAMGYQDIAETKFHNVTEYVEFITDKKMKGFKYLTVK